MKRHHPEAVKRTKAQAQRRLTELQRQGDTKTYTQPSRLTVGEYLKQWMRDYAESHVSRRTFEGFRGDLERYILPAIGGIALERPSARHTQERESPLLRNGGKNGAALSPGAVLQVHRILSKALKDAVQIGIIRRNVAEAVEHPRIPRGENSGMANSDITG